MFLSDKILGITIQLVQLFICSDTRALYPLLHFRDTVEIRFPLQAFLRFITFVGSRRRMPLWLCQFGHMDQTWDMLFSCYICGLFVCFTQACIIPTSDFKNFNSVCQLLFLETLEYFRNITFCSLGLIRHRNSITIIPNRNNRRNLMYSDSIDNFKKHTF
ncbi:hypothetical protein D3C81_1030220 [compost metagenome]